MLAEDKTQPTSVRPLRPQRDRQRQGEGVPGVRSTSSALLIMRAEPDVLGFKLKRRTALKKKYKVKVMRLEELVRSALDETAVGSVGATLNSKLRGHYQYYGINDNWVVADEVPRGGDEAGLSLAEPSVAVRSRRTGVSWMRIIYCFRLASPSRLTDLIALARRPWLRLWVTSDGWELGNGARRGCPVPGGIEHTMEHG